MKKLNKILLMAAMIVSFYGVSSAMGQFMFLENPLVGKTAPDFTLKTLSGPEVNFAKFRDGKPAILFFWATWCPHCREQIGKLNAKRSELEQKGIKLALIDIEEDADTVRSYLTEQKISLDVFLDETSMTARHYALVGVPTYFLVNQSGIVKSSEYAIPDNYEKILKE